jgi:hypothetical protein
VPRCKFVHPTYTATGSNLSLRVYRRLKYVIISIKLLSTGCLYFGMFVRLYVVNLN